MGSTPVAQSSGNASSSLLNSAFDLFRQLVLQSPKWVQAAVALAMAGALVMYVWPKPGSEASTGAAYPLSGGQRVSGPGDSQMEDATQHLTEDEKHSTWHSEQPDTPPMKKAFQIAEDNYLAYRYFEKSDRCVFVVRKENGKTSSYWLRDPQIRDAAAHGRENSGVNGNKAPTSDQVAGLGRILDALVPKAEAASLNPLPLQSGVHMQAVQAGCVAGTHGGQFTWWWGPPEDQCWAPMYRQWKDGCKHYQRFNRCANAWDDAIHWVSCAGGTHAQ